MMCSMLPPTPLVVWALLIMAGLNARESVVPFLFAEAVALAAYAFRVHKRIRQRPPDPRRRP